MTATASAARPRRPGPPPSTATATEAAPAPATTHAATVVTSPGGLDHHACHPGRSVSHPVVIPKLASSSRDSSHHNAAITTPPRPANAATTYRVRQAPPRRWTRAAVASRPTTNTTISAGVASPQPEVVHAHQLGSTSAWVTPMS